MVAVFVLDGAKRCRFMNAVAEHLTGTQSALAVGRPLAELVWRGDAQSFDRTHLARALAASGPEEGEETLFDSDGAKLPMAFRIVPLTIDAAGGVVVELYSLEGEIGAARALRESERRLRLAAEATGIGIWEVSPVTGQRHWSAEFFAILGLPPDTEPSTELFVSLIHPDDRGPMETLYRGIYEKPRSEPYDAEFRICRASDGAVRWVHSNGRVTFDNDGRPLRAIGTLRDVHERRQSEAALHISEERHRLAIEANELGTWDLDIVSGQHRWSARFRHLHGLPAEGADDPAKLRALIDPDERTRVDEAWTKATDPTGDGRYAVEHRIRRLDTGEPRWLSTIGRVFFDDAGTRPLRAVGITMDTTARKVVEEQQRKLLRELHHRINNNLAVVQAILSQTVRTTRRPGEAFARIHTRLSALARVHQLLARSEFGEAAIREIITAELSELGDFPDRITLDGNPVQLDSTSAIILALVFHELATNAARHGCLSGPEGRLSVSWSASGDRPVQVELTWLEEGGKKRSRRRHDGFGIRVIQDSIIGTLAGKADVEFGPKGVTWRLSLPLQGGGSPALAT